MYHNILAKMHIQAITWTGWSQPATVTVAYCFVSRYSLYCKDIPYQVMQKNCTVYICNSFVRTSSGW